jgi:hypothetical protein
VHRKIGNKEEASADLQKAHDADLDAFFAHYCRFYQQMTYDTVSFEVTVTVASPFASVTSESGEKEPTLSTRPFSSKYMPM